MNTGKRGIKSGMGIMLCLVGMITTSACFAAGDSIEIVKAEGNVATSDASGKQGKSVTTKSILPSKNVLTTGPNGRAVVRVGNVGIIVLEKNSKIEIDNSNDHASFLRQLTGMIYYAVNALKGDDKLDVGTKTATIGVRGTRFLIADIPERNEIDMRKGLVNITSPEGEFEIHRKAELNEFEAYQQEGRDAIAKEKKDFEEYKARTEHEFVEYKREFTLGANRTASFDGKRVVDSPLSAQSLKDLENSESYADEWIEEIHD